MLPEITTEYYSFGFQSRGIGMTLLSMDNIHSNTIMQK